MHSHTHTLTHDLSNTHTLHTDFKHCMEFPRLKIFVSGGWWCFTYTNTHKHRYSLSHKHTQGTSLPKPLQDSLQLHSLSQAAHQESSQGLSTDGYSHPFSSSLFIVATQLAYAAHLASGTRGLVGCLVKAECIFRLLKPVPSDSFPNFFLGQGQGSRTTQCTKVPQRFK